MDFISIKANDIQVGMPIPWAVYAEDGTLLLNKGFFVGNKKVKALILQRHGKREDSSAIQVDESLITERVVSLSCLELLNELAQKIEIIERKITAKEAADVQYFTRLLAVDIQYLAAKCLDRLLTVVMIEGMYEHHIMHPLQTAVYCELMARSQGFNENKRLPLLCAALTHDTGIRKIQKKLDEQPDRALSPLELKLVRNHSKKAYKRLKAAGVRSKTWLSVVLNHHERLDGSGYPRGLNAAELSPFDRMIAVADSFSAMLRKQSYCNQLDSENALETLLSEEDQYSQKMVLHLIGEVSMVSPGSIVATKSGETCVVVSRENAEGGCSVLPVLSRNGEPLSGQHQKDLSRDELQGFLSRREFLWVFLEFDRVWPNFELPVFRAVA